MPFVAHTTNHRLQRNRGLLLFTLNLFPFKEVFQSSGEAADQALAAVREDDESVIPEKLWNSILVIAHIVVKGVFYRFVRGFELTEDKRQAVDKAHHIGTPCMDRAIYPQL